MTTPRYLDVEEFKRWNRDEIRVDDDLIEAAINASEQWIDARAGRTLNIASGSASARSFRPNGCTDVIAIHDCDSISSVVENSVTLVAGTDYQAEPVDNIDASTGAYRPYTMIRKLTGDWYRDGHKFTVVVTADWGWATASFPPVIVEACKVLTADWLANREVRSGVVGSNESGFSIGVRRNPYVEDAIFAVARRRVAVA